VQSFVVTASHLCIHKACPTAVEKMDVHLVNPQRALGVKGASGKEPAPLLPRDTVDLFLFL
jgi:hypothetical protein